jgi:hypothetical protein
MVKRKHICIFCLLALIISGCASNSLPEMTVPSDCETFPSEETQHATEAVLPTETEPVLSEAELLLSQ